MSVLTNTTSQNILHTMHFLIKRNNLIFFIILLLTTIKITACGASKSSLDKTDRSYELTVNHPKPHNRYVVSGTRSYMICTQNGLCPPMGWHIKGEMGGVWINGNRSSIKIADGYWLTINGQLLDNPKTYTSGFGYSRFAYRLSNTKINIERTDLAPDDIQGVAIRYIIHNKSNKAQRISIRFDAKIDIMAPYPWEWNGARKVMKLDSIKYDSHLDAFTAKDVLFTKGYNRDVDTKIKGYAIVGGSLKPKLIISDDTSHIPNETLDKNDKGQIVSSKYEIEIMPHNFATLIFAFAGSDRNLKDARINYRKLIEDFDSLLNKKIDRYREFVKRTEFSLPLKRLSQALTWSKISLAMSESYIPKLGRGVVGGFPDYPWFFANDGAYTIYSLLATGRFDLAKEHLRLIARASRKSNGQTGKIIHEVVSNGTVYFGRNDDKGNTNETAQFIMALGQVHRWTGDRAFLNELYPIAKRGAQRFLLNKADRDKDLFPEGNGMVEREGMGLEKLDVAVYTYKALDELSKMARNLMDLSFADALEKKAVTLRARFNKIWWIEDEGCFADSLGDNNTQIFQGFWTLAIPFEVKISDSSRAHRCLTRLLKPRFNYKGGLYHNIGIGGIVADKHRWALPAGVLAVGLINYNMPHFALRPMNAIVNLMNHEMPGAFDEIMPPIEEEKLTELPNFHQAWSTYGIIWPVVHGFAGIKPNIPKKRIKIIPNPPSSWNEFGISNIRIGKNSYDIYIYRKNKRHTITVTPKRIDEDYEIEIGAIIPQNSAVVSVRLNDEEMSRSTYLVHERGNTKMVLAKVGFVKKPLFFTIKYKFK